MMKKNKMSPKSQLINSRSSASRRESRKPNDIHP